MRDYAGVSEKPMAAPFNPTTYLIQGVSTVLVLCTRESAECRTFRNNYIPRYRLYRPDVLIQFIYIPWDIWLGGKTESRYAFYVADTPTVHIYGPDGALIAADTPAKPKAGEKVLDQSLEEAIEALQQ